MAEIALRIAFVPLVPIMDLAFSFLEQSQHGVFVFASKGVRLT